MKRLLAVLAILTFPVLSFAADIDCDADSDNQMDLSCGGTNADTAANARTSLGVPATAATLVGSCTAGPCLDGTSDGGDLIKLYGSLGFWTSLQAGAATANVNWRLPLANPAAGTTRIINTDEYGNMGLLDPATFLTPSGAGGSLTFTASGFNGNLLTTTDTLQELADAVDDLSITGGYINLTSFEGQTAWRVFYSDTDGDVTELALGADGTYLKSNGAAAAPTWATPSGSGDMVLATAQTVTGKKTFENSDIALLGSSTGATTFASANAGATDYTTTFPASTGTVAYISDTAYDATSWNAVTDTAPSKNAVRDAIEALPSLTIQTTAITTGANNILGSDYGLIADTDGDGLPNKVDLAAAGFVKAAADGGISSTSIVETIAGLSMDGGGSDILDGVKGDKRVAFASHITTMTITSTASCSSVVDIWKDTYANFPATVDDAITGGGKPTLSTATKAQITGLNIAVAAGDMIRFNVDSNNCTGIVNVTLEGTRD